MPIRLTETAIQKAARETEQAGKRRDLTDAVCEGLRLRLTPRGGKAWVLATRDRDGKMRRFALGSFPTMGIAQARDAARSLHAKVKHEGADPIADARRRRADATAAQAGIGTLAALLALYGERKGGQLKSWPHSRLRIDRVFRALLARSVASLTVGDLQFAADIYRAPKSASFAVRTLRPVLKWAAEAGRAYVAPELAQLREPTSLARRQRVLSRDELAAILPVLRRSAHGRAMQFMLLTLARREEVCAACWRDINLSAAIWTIPATKNSLPHTVPLSRQACALLRDVVESDPGALVFRGARGGSLGNWDRAQKAIHAISATAGWHRHDLRRTGATMIGELGVPPHIIESALNHVAIHSRLAATYNRSRYRVEVADALQRLADLLDNVEHGGAEVIPLRPVV
jgi:integrase